MKEELKASVEQSEKVKQAFQALVLVAPQILDEEDYHDLKLSLDTIATNFETAASFIYQFQRMGIASKKFTPIKK